VPDFVYKGSEEERVAFEQDLAAAREALGAGDLNRAVQLAVSPAHKYWFAKEPARFELLRELYSLIPQPVDAENYRETSWQRKLITELYAIWPKSPFKARFWCMIFPRLRSMLKSYWPG
jgi:hypothetical protein